jgi:hypothetical protein
MSARLYDREPPIYIGKEGCLKEQGRTKRSNSFVKTKTWYFGAAFKATPNHVEGTIARYDWAAIRLRLRWQQVLSKI